MPYLCMRAHLVFLRIFLYLCLRIFFRRFLTTDDKCASLVQFRRGEL